MSRSNQEPQCCFCIHVKAGTSFLAGFMLMSGLVCSVFSALLLSGTLSTDDMISEDVYNYYKQHPRSTLWIGLGNGLFLAVISFMAIYGLVKNRSGYLLPLFIVQLFNYLCSVIYIGSLMFYWPNVKEHLKECRHIPAEWSQWLMNLDDRWLACIVFGVLFLYLIVKSYLISMVYKCYKHMTHQALRLRQDPEISYVQDIDQNAGPIYKPPKYEDIQKVPLVADVDDYDTKPPSYYP